MVLTDGEHCQNEKFWSFFFRCLLRYPFLKSVLILKIKMIFCPMRTTPIRELWCLKKCPFLYAMVAGDIICFAVGNKGSAGVKNLVKRGLWCRLTVLPGVGTQLWVLRHVPPKRPYFFSLALTERPPFLPTFTQWPPIFNKLLVTEILWHILVTQRPLIFAFSSQTSGNFWQKNWIFRKFRQIWRTVEKFLAILALKAPIFWCISLKDPLFLCALSLKDPLFDAICHRKTPTSEVLGGTRTSLSYVSAPPPPSCFVVSAGSWTYPTQPAGLHGLPKMYGYRCVTI